MNDLKVLLDYLNPKKHQKDNSVNEKYLFTQINRAYSEYVEDLQVNDIDSSDLTTRIRYAINLGYGDPFQPLPGSFFSTSLYAEFNGDDVNYYFAKDFNGETRYITIENILDQETSDPFYQDYSDLDLVFIQSGENLYYHVGQKMLYTMSVIPTEIVVISKRTLSYNPNELGGLKSKSYQLDFDDTKGNNLFNDRNSRSIQREQIQNRGTPERRRVFLNLNPKKGEVYWYPKVIFNDGITLYYQYHPFLNEDKELKKETSAIRIRFPHPETFLAFVNLVYFNNGISPFDYFSTEGGRDQKAEFFVAYVRIINTLLKGSETINDKLVYLYYIPGDFFAKNQRLFKKMGDPSNLLGAQFIWDVIGEALEDSLTNLTIRKEDIALILLRSLKTIYDNKTIESEKEKLQGNTTILKYLLEKKTSNGNSYFLQLFNKIDGDNFADFNNLMKAIWYDSSYFNDENPIYKEKVGKGEQQKLKYDGPIALPYKSDKTLGFYHSNVNISWSGKGTVLDTELETGKLKSVKNKGYGYRVVADNLFFDYHPYQPIYLVDSQNQKTALKLDYVIPAFYLKAVETKKTTANVYTGIEYAVDILTTFSGVGNLAKFRHLTKIAARASRLRKAQKVVSYATTLSKIKQTAGIVEITSGTVNTLFKLTGIKDSELGASISEFLFWLEMASLSGEVVGAIKTGLRKNAKKITNKRNFKLLEKQLDQLVESKNLDTAGKGKFLAEMRQIANSGSSRLDINRLVLNYAIVASKSTDDVSKVIKKAEEDILNLVKGIDPEKQFEWGFFHNEAKGFRSKKPFTSFSNDEIDFDYAFDSGWLTNQRYKSLKGSTFTHNHPNFTRFSNSDIKIFLEAQLKEFRAINTDGIVYSLRLKKGTKVSPKEVRRAFKELRIKKNGWIQDFNLNPLIDEDKLLLQDFEEEFLLNTFGNVLDYKIFV